MGEMSDVQIKYSEFDPSGNVSQIGGKQEVALEKQQELSIQEQAAKFGGRLDTDDWQYIQLLANKTNEMLGRVAAHNDNSSKDTVFVDDLWVDNSVRNMGVATFLVSVFEQLASQHNINKIRLFASGEGDLFTFYNKLGYNRETPTSTIMTKYLNSTPLHVEGLK
ncbi:GNAT family N-acetyltransferase [Candidatus Roizmanbacteria bacterium]|nr:GNAT family N-acetyltransferase [Candidatus Roizmanbacteria bacterium]